MSLQQWKQVTGDLPWGVQQVLKSTLELVQEEQVHLVYGQDYREGKPCLINAAATMLAANAGVGGSGIPSQYFGDLVRNFDAINRELESSKINDGSGYVSPLAAEVLLRNFGELKEKPVSNAVDEAMASAAFAADIPYREPSDADMARDFMNMMKAPPPELLEGADAERDPVVQFTKDYVEAKRKEQ